MHLIRFSVNVEETQFDKKLILRVSLPIDNSVDSRISYRDLIYTQSYQNIEKYVETYPISVVQPLKIHQKLKGNLLCLSVENKLIIPIELKSLHIDCDYELKESFELPIILNPFESYSFILTINSPIISQKEITNDASVQRTKNESFNSLLSPRVSLISNETQNQQIKEIKQKRMKRKTKEKSIDDNQNNNEIDDRNHENFEV